MADDEAPVLDTPAETPLTIEEAPPAPVEPAERLEILEAKLENLIKKLAKHGITFVEGE